MAKTSDTGGSTVNTDESQEKRDEPAERIHTELPSRPIPSKKAYEFPDYESWTDEELHRFAENLGITGQEAMERDALIDVLLAREHR